MLEKENSVVKKYSRKKKYEMKKANHVLEIFCEKNCESQI